MFGLLLTVGSHGTAQQTGNQGTQQPVDQRDASSVPSSIADSVVTLPLFQLLPLVRPLMHPPTVASVGDLSASQGHPVHMPVSAAMAVVDIRQHMEQLESVFPPSALNYPADSIRRSKVARAAAWLERLHALSMQATGRELLAFADLAMQAEQDTLAQRFYDRRLRELVDGRPVSPGLRSALVERSLTLVAAVTAFGNPSHDPERLARNTPIARAYLKQLMALPQHGYATKNDSVSVLSRRGEFVFGFLPEYARLAVVGDSVMTSLFFDCFDAALALLPHRYGMERTAYLTNYIPWSAVTLVVLRIPNGSARLAAIRAQVDSLVTFRPGELMDLPAEVRARKQARAREIITHEFALADRIAQPFPPIAAHAWLNTPDSVYDTVPRTHRFDDGRIHVLMMGRYDDESLARLDRIQRQFAGKIQVLYAIETQGHTGPDVVDGPTEVAWLAKYYRDVRHFVVPIAVWAGAKVAGDNGTHIPASSPSLDAYRNETAFVNVVNTAMVLDGHGRLVAYHQLRSSTDEMQLVKSLQRVLASKL